MGSPSELRNTVITLYVLSFLAVVTRCLIRTTIAKPFRCDDGLMVATLVVFTCYTAFVLCGVHYGTGQHITDLTVQNARTAKMYWYFCGLTYVLTTALIKLTIAALLLRIAIEPWHIRALKTLMAVVCTFGLFTFFFGTCYIGT